MAMYRKKPIVIDAFKWTGDINQEEDPEWIIEALSKPQDRNPGWAIIGTGEKGLCMIISTLEGEHIANQGDYIVRGVKGEIYPCKPDIFEMSYEKVED